MSFAICNTSRPLIENLSAAAKQGFIVAMGPITEKKKRILSRYYDYCHEKGFPMISVRLHTEGPGEVKYDLITTDRKKDYRMDYEELRLELISIYNSLPRDFTKTLRTKFLNARMFDVGYTLGVAAFPENDWRVLNCVVKHAFIATRQFEKLSLQDVIHWSLKPAR